MSTVQEAVHFQGAQDPILQPEVPCHLLAAWPRYAGPRQRFTECVDLVYAHLRAGCMLPYAVP
jgi:hypothetical protein